MGRKRIPGGEKNEKSGVRWTEEEIVQVYFLYKDLKGEGLHENNPKIQKLAEKLNRTTRSTEAQTLMFRNLERDGNYSHGNMNKLTKKVWRIFENGEESDPKNNEIIINKMENPNELQDPERLWNYDDWNKALIQNFFNEGFKETEIACFPINSETFREVSIGKYGSHDFVRALKRRIKPGDFFSKLEELKKSSQSKKLNGRTLQKPLPDYFGFIVFLIYALNRYKGQSLPSSNVYGRINSLGSELLGSSWKDISSSISREILESVWDDLEKWSIARQKKQLGYFRRLDPKNEGRKYVSRIERHALLNSGDFKNLFDIFIDKGIPVGSIISDSDWENIFTEHQEKIRNSARLLEYIQEDSTLKESVLRFLNSYVKINYTNEVTSSPKGKHRKPPLEIRICIKGNELKQFQKNVNNFHFRIYSDDFDEDYICYKGDKILIEEEQKGYSQQIILSENLTEGWQIQGQSNRYVYRTDIKWLTKNHVFEEWIETSEPTNGVFLLLVDPEQKEKISGIGKLNFREYELGDSGLSILYFNEVNPIEYNALRAFIKPNQDPEGGKIELLTEFAIDRRRTLFPYFPPKFSYKGSCSNPNLQIEDRNGNIIMSLKNYDNEESDNVFCFPENFEIPKEEFQIVERETGITSHFYYTFKNLDQVRPTNVENPCLKDSEGKVIDEEVNSTPLYDIPPNFNREFGAVTFNTWHMNLFSIFKKKNHRRIKLNTDCVFLKNHKGNNLLQFLSVSNQVRTYDFPKLLQQINTGLTSKFAKRIMHYWRDLGYINFEDFGERIQVSTTSIFFLSTKRGLTGFLSGFRNSAIIDRIKKDCKDLGITINFCDHSSEYADILPQKILLIDPDGDIDKFLELKRRMPEINFVNNIQNPLNSSYVVYQLACFFTQKSVMEFRSNLTSLIDYPTDHHRKRIFDHKTLQWVDSNKDVADIPPHTLIRYDGFPDKQVRHIYTTKDGNKELIDFRLATFSSLQKNILFQKFRKDNIDQVDLWVPLYIGLPFWLERGLILINAELPRIEKQKNNGKLYRIYEAIDDRIIKVIEEKLEQTIQKID